MQGNPTRTDMKKSKKILPLILLLLVTVLTLVACGETKENPTNSGPYSVKYVVDGIIEKTATIENKADINGHFTPEKEGYIFDGWYLDKSFTKPLSAEENPSTNLALYAKLTKKTFTVKFFAENKEIQSVSVPYGDSATAPTPPEVPSKVFEKWDTDFSCVKSDLTVIAIYSETEKYTAKFLLNGTEIYSVTISGGEKTQKVAESALKALDIPDGFEFLGWATLLDKAMPDEFPERNVEYKAVLGIKGISPSFASTFAGNQIEYTTDKLTFTASHQAFEGIEYKYQWYLNGNSVGNEKSIAIDCPDVGNHLVKVIVTASSDLAKSISENVSYNFIVTPATLSQIDVENASFVYDGKPHNIKVQTQTGDVVEYRLNDGEWASSLNIVNAGEYEIYVRLTRKNYEVYETSTPMVLSIDKKVVTGTIVTKTISYGDDLPTTYKVNYSGFIGTDNQSVFSGDIIFTANTLNSLTIGTYKVTGDTSGHVADNYTLTLQNGTLEITKRVLVVTAVSQTIVVGDPLPTLTIKYDGFAPGEGVDDLDTIPVVVCGYTQGGTAGKYAITVGGGESEHYHFVYKEGTLTVSRT